MKKILALAGCVLLSSCMQNSTPKEIAQQYWQAMQTGNYTKARSLVSSGTQPAFDQYVNLPKDEKIPLDAVALTDTRANVTTIINTGNRSVEFNTVLTLHDGHWEVDANETHVPPAPSSLGKNLDDMMQQLGTAMKGGAEQMKQALSKNADMLNKALKDSSQQLSDSMDKKLQELNKAIQDATQELKQKNQQAPANPAPKNAI